MKCQVRPEGGPNTSFPHKGKVKQYQLQADSQPPGKGTATIKCLVNMCQYHYDEFFNDGWQFSNIKVKRHPKKANRDIL